MSVVFVLCVVIALLDGGQAACTLAGSSEVSVVDMPTHVLKDPVFWDHFQKEVRSRSWKCPFPRDLLTRDLEKDSRLYSNDTVLIDRRKAVGAWLQNETGWAEFMLGACREIADGREGKFSGLLRDHHMLEALDDYVEHLHCFEVVAMVMASKGRRVTPLSQDSSRVHDLDKLDPVMLAGYSEKFEDKASTSVWEECVARHTLVNPHHQAHPMWHAHRGNCSAHVVTELGLSEMVCDKVSRKLQKELGGVVSDQMWDIDLGYFAGLPPDWLDRAKEILEEMKRKSTREVSAKEEFGIRFS